MNVFASSEGSRRLRLAVAMSVALSIGALAWPAGAAPQAAESERLEALEAEVAALAAELAALAADGGGTPGERLAEVERRLEILAAEIERLQLGEAAPEADRVEHGMGPAATKVYRVEQGLSIGGYGEMIYQGFDSRRDDGADSGRTDQIDFLRAIVYFGYKFNDDFVFNSEIEFEHASTGSGGEASVEFAYLDWLWRPEANVRGGLLLVPMGLLNELHEPTVFATAKRPDVERALIPTTWRENGLGLWGDVGSVTYRTYLLNGLEASGFSAGGLRGGRQKGAQASAEDFAWVGRVDWTGVPGLLVGGSAYAGDSGQGLELPDGGEVSVATTLLEGHFDWRWQGLRLRGLAARAELDDVAALDLALGLTGNRSVGEEMTGWYVEAAYDLLAGRGGGRSLMPYVRWEELDTQAEVPAGFVANPANDVESLTLGVAFQPIDQIILKADYQDYDNGAGTAIDQINLALGYII
jgi:hypothetical protein